MELRYLFKKTQTTSSEPENKNEEQIPSAPQGLFHKSFVRQLLPHVCEHQDRHDGG